MAITFNDHTSFSDKFYIKKYYVMLPLTYSFNTYAAVSN